jgi:putative membrane protein insertion efficiency factor|tara:strand:- start:1405 stop:1659 length:255 start_codon:yes stop_codon:yes gene_type:complete
MNTMKQSSNIGKATAKFLIRGYQQIFSFREPTCRYFPSCSEYTSEAVDHYGVIKGSWISMKRLFRCHPWGNSGYDPVPGRPENV